MNYNLLEWVTIINGIGGMILFMSTYQICTIYIKKNREDIGLILYEDKKRLDGKIDGYDIHFLLITSSMIFSHYHTFYRWKKNFYLESLPWCPNLSNSQALAMYTRHKKLLVMSEISFMSITIWLFVVILSYGS